MSLGDLVKDTIPVSTIKGMITKFFKEDRPLPPLRFEDDAYVRASGLSYLCPRAEVICNLINLETRRNKFPADAMLTLTHGTALHWAMQNKILPELDILLGQWSCLECGTKYGLPNGAQALTDFLVKRPEVCTKGAGTTEACNSKEFQYCEMHFKDATYRIGGHPDGFLKIPGMPGLGLLEVKSANAENAFKAESGPFKDHIIQANIYMWLTRLEWTKFIYWDKAGRGTSAIIEHTIYKDNNLIEDIKKDLKDIWQGIETRTLPSRTSHMWKAIEDKLPSHAKPQETKATCTSIKCARAKKCVVSDICFKNDDKLSLV